jgi:hypothetical protein
MYLPYKNVTIISKLGCHSLSYTLNSHNCVSGKRAVWRFLALINFTLLSGLLGFRAFSIIWYFEQNSKIRTDKTTKFQNWTRRKTQISWTVFVSFFKQTVARVATQLRPLWRRMFIISCSEKTQDKPANQLGARVWRQQQIHYPKRYTLSEYWKMAKVQKPHNPERRIILICSLCSWKATDSSDKKTSFRSSRQIPNALRSRHLFTNVVYREQQVFKLLKLSRGIG